MRWNKRVSNYPNSLWDLNRLANEQTVARQRIRLPASKQWPDKESDFQQANNILRSHDITTPRDLCFNSGTTLTIHYISYSIPSHPPEHLSTFSTVFHINFFRQLPFQLYSTINYQPDDPEENDDPQESTEGFNEDNFMRWQLETIRSSELDPS